MITFVVNYSPSLIFLLFFFFYIHRHMTGKVTHHKPLFHIPWLSQHHHRHRRHLICRMLNNKGHVIRLLTTQSYNETISRQTEGVIVIERKRGVTNIFYPSSFFIWVPNFLPFFRIIEQIIIFNLSPDLFCCLKIKHLILKKNVISIN